jgi:hypothetical protein
MYKITVKERLSSGKVVTHQYRDNRRNAWKNRIGQKLYAGQGGKIISVKARPATATRKSRGLIRYAGFRI